MSSAFLHVQHHHKNYCPSSNNKITSSKPHFESPKQLLQLRSQVRPLSLHQPVEPQRKLCRPFAHLHTPPRLSGPTTTQTTHLTYIEKDKRGIRPMIPQQNHYQAFDRPLHHQNHHSRKMTLAGAPLMRTPSSGFSSASSSENMLSGLSLSDNENKIHEIMDPSVEVDLDMFLLPDVRYKQATQAASTSRVNLSQFSDPSQNGGSTRQLAPPHAKSALPSSFADYSYANVKRSNGYIDYMPTTYATKTVSQPSTSSAAMSPGTWIRCQFCWESYVKLCQKVSNSEPVVPCDGPWQWHTLYDSQGRVTCPRLWFTQLDRAGADMLHQMASMHMSNF